MVYHNYSKDCILILLRARRNKKRIEETKIWYLESQQKALLNLTKNIKNNKIFIYISNGKYSYNQKKSKLQYLISPNCPSEYLSTQVSQQFLIPRF